MMGAVVQSESQNDESITISLSLDEIVILNNSLNEVCNGVEFEDGEFQTRIGYPRQRVRELLRKMNSL